MCGTIVAANVLERRRQMKCPRFDCEYILEYEQLPEDDRQYFEQYQQKYTI
jgi:hypothetical protein